MGIKLGEPIWTCDLCDYSEPESIAKKEKWIDFHVEGNFDERLHKVICTYCLKEIEKAIKKT